MAAKGIRMMAGLKNGVTTVKAIITHPMESGNRKVEGKAVPAHYIQEVECFLNGNSVMKSYWGGGIQKNPYLSFRIKDAKQGDKVKLAWKDNKGEQGEKEVAIK
jgi:sulfur-oxidizing protein SoxZ